MMSYRASEKSYKAHRSEHFTSMAFEDEMCGIERRESFSTKCIRRVMPDEALR